MCTDLVHWTTFIQANKSELVWFGIFVLIAIALIFNEECNCADD